MKKMKYTRFLATQTILLIFLTLFSDTVHANSCVNLLKRIFRPTESFKVVTRSLLETPDGQALYNSLNRPELHLHMTIMGIKKEQYAAPEDLIHFFAVLMGKDFYIKKLPSGEESDWAKALKLSKEVTSAIWSFNKGKLQTDQIEELAKKINMAFEERKRILKEKTDTAVINLSEARSLNQTLSRFKKFLSLIHQRDPDEEKNFLYSFVTAAEKARIHALAGEPLEWTLMEEYKVLSKVLTLYPQVVERAIEQAHAGFPKMAKTLNKKIKAILEDREEDFIFEHLSGEYTVVINHFFATIRGSFKVERDGKFHLAFPTENVSFAGSAKVSNFKLVYKDLNGTLQVELNHVHSFDDFYTRAYSSRFGGVNVRFLRSKIRSETQ